MIHCAADRVPLMRVAFQGWWTAIRAAQTIIRGMDG